MAQEFLSNGVNVGRVVRPALFLVLMVLMACGASPGDSPDLDARIEAAREDHARGRISRAGLASSNFLASTGLDGPLADEAMYYVSRAIYVAPDDAGALVEIVENLESARRSAPNRSRNISMAGSLMSHGKARIESDTRFAMNGEAPGAYDGLMLDASVASNMAAHSIIVTVIAETGRLAILDTGAELSSVGRAVSDGHPDWMRHTEIRVTERSWSGRKDLPVLELKGVWFGPVEMERLLVTEHRSGDPVLDNSLVIGLDVLTRIGSLAYLENEPFIRLGGGCDPAIWSLQLELQAGSPGYHVRDDHGRLHTLDTGLNTAYIASRGAPKGSATRTMLTSAGSHEYAVAPRPAGHRLFEDPRLDQAVGEEIGFIPAQPSRVDGTIGMPFLTRFSSACIDFQKMRLELGEPRVLHTDGTGQES